MYLFLVNFKITALSHSSCCVQYILMKYSEMDKGMYHFISKIYAYNEFIHRIIYSTTSHCY